MVYENYNGVLHGELNKSVLNYHEQNHITMVLLIMLDYK